MIDASTRALLQWAVDYVTLHNEETRQRHLNPRTREIEPGSVRREVLAANQWLEKARRALKQTNEPELVDTLPPSDRDGDTGMVIREQDCKVRVTFDRPCEFIAMDAGRATQVINALIRHARVAGRKTGRPVEVRL